MDIEKILLKAVHHVPGIQDAKEEYSVLLALELIDGEYSLLYEVRSDKVDRQPGEICFPGGRMEPEETPVECALRETHEELGIPPEMIELFCELDTFHPACGIVIRPFLARLRPGALEKMILSPEEVKEVFFVPLRSLREGCFTYPYVAVRQLEADFPFEMIGIDENYKWNNICEELVVYRHEEHVIWGFTALMTRALMRLLRELEGPTKE